MSTTSFMIAESAPGARPAWPERVIALGAEWKRATGQTEQDRILGELWLLVNAGLARYLRVHGSGRPQVTSEDLRDIASEKCLELLRKLHAGSWDPTVGSPAELCSFLSTLARNGVIDHVRAVQNRRRPAFREGRRRPTPVEPDGYSPKEGGTLATERADYARGLLDCAATLQVRARRIWFLRVFLELSSRQIARHPEVAISPAAVDVTLARCRVKMRTCMREKGFEPRDMPPGTFATLWEALFRSALPGP